MVVIVRYGKTTTEIYTAKIAASIRCAEETVFPAQNNWTRTDHIDSEESKP